MPSFDNFPALFSHMQSVMPARTSPTINSRRLGPKRKMKKAVEDYSAGKSSKADLVATQAVQHHWDSLPYCKYIILALVFFCVSGCARFSIDHLWVGKSHRMSGRLHSPERLEFWEEPLSQLSKGNGEEQYYYGCQLENASQFSHRRSPVADFYICQNAYRTKDANSSIARVYSGKKRRQESR